jgi:hypothetical protein
MNRFLLLLLLPVVAGCAALRSAPPPQPAWIGRSIYSDDRFVYAVGHSQPQESEKRAKDEAVSDATAAFIKYCGVSVESFDRSIEAYARDGEGRERSDSRIASQVELRSHAFVREALPISWYAVRRGSSHAASVLLRVPKAEVARIQNEKDVQLSLDVLLYHEDDDGKMKPLTEGAILRSGGGFAVYARPSDESYVYLFEIDGLDRTFRLFPNPAFGTGENPLAGGKAAWIPNERGLLILDNTTGKERLYLFASRERIPEFEGTGAPLSGKNLDDLVAVKKMGVIGLREKRDVVPISPPQKTTDVLAAKNKLQAQGGFVYETWFWHK